MFLLMWDLKLKAIRGRRQCWLSISAAAPTAPTASTLYLIRLDEFRGEGKATEYRWTKKGNKGRESFHYLLFMNFNCWNVNTREPGGRCQKVLLV